WSYVGLAIRSQGDQAALFSAVRGIVAELDSELPVHDMRPMEQVVAETLATRRLALWLVGAFGALALVLSFVGIYGVMSYAVTERVHEIGVRTALGARRRDIFRLFIGSGMRLAGIGLVLGAAAALLCDPCDDQSPVRRQRQRSRDLSRDRSPSRSRRLRRLLRSGTPRSCRRPHRRPPLRINQAAPPRRLRFSTSKTC